ncbi:RING finger protein 145-like [Lucilia sericata]|uniref:RING finger protein 145-like n=1 Tax=Lucilia sericata TaxID=13632 RepID=UPI0018A838DE|nr:RING finger protein 145-like [Lucilia sericata]
MATEPTTSPISLPPPLPSASVSIEPSVCQICKQSMSEGQSCLIINECSHAFHRSCIETHLATSSECPICKRHCQLSELKKLVIHPRGSLAKPTFPKPRGAMAKHYNTRSVSRNVGQNPSDTSFIMEPNEDPMPSSVTNAPNPTIDAVNEQNNTAPNSNNGIDYQEINRMIEQSLSRLLANMNFASNNNPEVAQTPIDQLVFSIQIITCLTNLT